MFFNCKFNVKYYFSILINTWEYFWKKYDCLHCHPIRWYLRFFVVLFNFYFFSSSAFLFFVVSTLKPITCLYIFGRCVCVSVGRALCVYVEILVVSPMQAHKHHINGLLSYMLSTIPNVDSRIRLPMSSCWRVPFIPILVKCQLLEIILF